MRNSVLDWQKFCKVKFPTLLPLFIDKSLRRIDKKDKKFLANSSENTDVFYEYSDLKVYTSAYSPNKKRGFLIYKLSK